MKTHNVAAIALAAAGLLWADAASATIEIVNPAPGTYTQVAPRNPGIYGVELRSGNNATNGDWEIGVGTQTSTSNPALFAQGQLAWPAYDTPVSFSMTWLANKVSVTVGGVGVEYSADWLRGNTVELQAKRDAKFIGLTLTDIGGSSLSSINLNGPGNVTPNTNTLLLSGITDYGWTLTGQIALKAGSGNTGSKNELFVTMGTYTPVPVPAALPIIGAALAGFGFAGWRQRKAA